MIAAMGGYHFIRDDEIIYERSASKDKDFVVGSTQTQSRTCSITWLPGRTNDFDGVGGHPQKSGIFASGIGYSESARNLP